MTELSRKKKFLSYVHSTLRLKDKINIKSGISSLALTQFFHMLVLANRALQPSQPQVLVLLLPLRCSLDACQTELYSMLERSKLNYWKLKVGELFQITLALSLLSGATKKERMEYKIISL